LPTRSETVATTESTILPPEPNRIMATIQNVDPANPIWISDQQGRAQAHIGLKLGPMGSLTLRLVDGDRPDITWYASAENAAVTATILENFYSGPAPGGGSGGGGTTPNSQGSSAAAMIIAFGAGGILR